MRLDLRDPRTLLKSWLATLHGPDLSFQADPDRPLAPLAALLRTALAWHVAYALFSYGGALAIARGGADNAVAQAVAAGGTWGVVVMMLVLWWGGVGLSSVLWWSGVRRARRGATKQRSAP